MSFAGTCTHRHTRAYTHTQRVVIHSFAHTFPPTSLSLSFSFSLSMCFHALLRVHDNGNPRLSTLSTSARSTRQLTFAFISSPFLISFLAIENKKFEKKTKQTTIDWHRKVSWILNFLVYWPGLAFRAFDTTTRRRAREFQNFFFCFFVFFLLKKFKKGRFC